MVNENKKIHLNKISREWCELIKENDSKRIWNAIGWNGKIENDDFMQEKPSSRDLSPHFLTKSNADEHIDTSIIPTDIFVQELDGPVLLQEVKDTANLLKEGRSTCDG